MKQNDDYIMSELGEEAVLIPVGEAAEKFHGIIRLNTTARDIWNGISDGLSEDRIAEKLVNDYEGVDFETAKREVIDLVKKFRAAGALID